MLFYFLAFVLVVSLIVFVHEFGHYFFAKICGVKVEEFSVGFGKEIFGINDRSGTRWKFCMIPAGGYVKMLGDANQASTPDSKALDNMSQEDQSASLHFKPTYQKALVAFGGPLANFVFAAVVLFVFYLCLGKPFVQPIVSSLAKDSAAYHAGIKVGDKIIKIADTKIQWFEDITRAMNLSSGNDIEVVVLRDGDSKKLLVHPEMIQTTDVFGNQITAAKLGIISESMEYYQLGVLQSLGYSVLEIKNVISATLKMLSQIVLGKRDSSVIGGPLRIAKYSGQSFEKGFAFFFWFIAMLSINLGLVNLFPIPMLDGGHLLFYFIEAVKGSAISNKYQEYAAKVGFLVIAGIFLFATLNDIFFIIKS